MGPPPGARRVVVVPGLLDVELADGAGQLLWPGQRLLTRGLFRLEVTQHRLVARTSPASSSVRLTERLRARGFAAHVAPVDTRLSVDEQLRQLRAFLSELPPAVHLVGHGSGGVVALAHRAATGSRGTVVTVGTPSGPCPAARRLLDGTHPLIDALAQLELASRDEVRRVVETWPILVELANETHRARSAPDLRILGTGWRTPTGTGAWVDGDGRTPADPPGPRIRFVGACHAELPAHPDVADAVVEVAIDGSEHLLSEAPVAGPASGVLLGEEGVGHVSSVEDVRRLATGWPCGPTGLVVDVVVVHGSAASSEALRLVATPDRTGLTAAVELPPLGATWVAVEDAIARALRGPSDVSTVWSSLGDDLEWLPPREIVDAHLRAFARWRPRGRLRLELSFTRHRSALAAHAALGAAGTDPREAIAGGVTVGTTRFEERPGGTWTEPAATEAWVSVAARLRGETVLLEVRDGAATWEVRVPFPAAAWADVRQRLDHLRPPGGLIGARAPLDGWLPPALLHRVGGRSVSILVDADTAVLPWELLWPGPPGDPAGIRQGIVRCLSVEGGADRAMPPSGETPWFIASAGLPGGAQQVRAIARISGWPAVTDEGLLDTLRTGPRRSVVHLACHGTRWGPDREQVLVVGLDPPVLARAGDLLAAGAPELVFLSACDTGGPGSHGHRDSLVATLLDAGVRAVVAPAWKVDDLAARDFAIAFHEVLCGGGTLGAATRAGRAAAWRHGRAHGDLTWCAIQVWGDEGWRLPSQKRGSSWAGRPATTSERLARLADLQTAARAPEPDVEGLASRVRACASGSSDDRVGEAVGMTWAAIGRWEPARKCLEAAYGGSRVSAGLGEALADMEIALARCAEPAAAATLLRSARDRLLARMGAIGRSRGRLARLGRVFVEAARLDLASAVPELRAARGWFAAAVCVDTAEDEGIDAGCADVGVAAIDVLLGADEELRTGPPPSPTWTVGAAVRRDLVHALSGGSRVPVFGATMGERLQAAGDLGTWTTLAAALRAGSRSASVWGSATMEGSAGATLACEVRGGNHEDLANLRRAFDAIRADVRLSHVPAPGDDLRLLAVAFGVDVRVLDRATEPHDGPIVIRSDHADDPGGWALAAADTFVAETWLGAGGRTVLLRHAEDADPVARQLARGFRERGFEVLSATGRGGGRAALAEADLVVVLVSPGAPGLRWVQERRAEARGALIMPLLVLWPAVDLPAAVRDLGGANLPDERVTLRLLDLHGSRSTGWGLVEDAVRRVVVAALRLRARSAIGRMEGLRAYVSQALGVGPPPPGSRDVVVDGTRYRPVARPPDAAAFGRLADDLGSGEVGRLIYLETAPYGPRARALLRLRDDLGLVAIAVPHGPRLLSGRTARRGAAAAGSGVARALLLVASVPYDRDPLAASYLADSRPELIREAVTWLCQFAFAEDERGGGWTLVFGGHPAISPMVLEAAAEAEDGDALASHCVVVYQSRAFADRIPEPTRALWNWRRGRLEWVGRPDTVADPGHEASRDAALRELRAAMVRHPGLVGAVVIGGMDGAEAEVRAVVAAGLPVFALPRTGGAAARVSRWTGVTPLDEPVPAAIFALFRAVAGPL